MKELNELFDGLAKKFNEQVSKMESQVEMIDALKRNLEIMKKEKLKLQGELIDNQSKLKKVNQLIKEVGL